MTFITHGIFAGLTASAAGQGQWHILAAAIGSLFPDIDTPRSIIGKVFFFISIPLNRRFGHREEVHMLFIWSIPLLIGIILRYEFVQWMGIGALSHSIIDTYNTKGAAILKPLTDRIVVIFKSPKWRIRSGQREEIIFAALLLAAFLGTQHIQQIGGWRSFLGRILQSPQNTVERYIDAGNQRCEVQGKFRWHDGRIQKKVQWLIIGTESGRLVCWDGSRLIRPKHGEFLRSVLITNSKEARFPKVGEEWAPVRVNGIVIVGQDSLYYGGNQWFFAQKGQRAFGYIKSITAEVPQLYLNK